MVSMRILVLSLFILFFCLVSSSAVIAQGPSDPYLVYGQVTRDGEPLEGVLIRITADKNGHNLLLETDQNGDYQLNSLNWHEGDLDEGDMYRITITYEGETIEEERRVKYWSEEAEQRMGDEINVDLKGPDDPLAVLGLMGFIGFLGIMWIAFLPSGVEKKEEEE